MNPSQQAQQTARQTLLAAAAAWQVRRQDGLSAQEEAQFQDWLAADARHRAAYARFDSLWEDLAQLHPDAVAQLSTATAASTAQVPARRHWLAWLRWQPFAPSLATAAVTVCVLGAGWMGWNYWQQQPIFSQQYATARGEQLDVHLPDGSVIKLDTATRAQVTLYRHHREVHLPEGQAMFTVKADKNSPFDVLTDSLRITVVGTRFSVRHTHTGLGQDGTGVMVEEGRVRVSPRYPAAATTVATAAAASTVLLTAGQYIQSGAAGQLGALEKQPTRGAMLWREGRVSFDGTPLSQAVAEFERYGATHVLVKDPAVAAMRVNGSFDLRQADAFSQTLPLVLPVQLRVHGNVTEIVAAAPKK